MRRLLSAVAALFVLAGCHSAPPEEKAEEPTVTVEAVQAVRQDMRRLLEVQGNFAAPQGGAAKLTPQVAGRLQNIYVKEGDVVTAGQLLAKVDVKVQASQQQSALAAAQAAQAQTAQSQLSYQAAVADQSANVRTAQLSLESAQLDRDTTVTQAQVAYQSAVADLAKTRSQSEQAIVQARIERDRAVADYERSQKLAAEGFVSKRDLETAKATSETAESNLKSAIANQPLDIKSAELKAAGARDALSGAKSLGEKKVAQAEAALRQAKAGQANVAAKQQEVNANQSLAKQKQADLSTAAATTGLGEIRAPFSGRVVKRNLNPGDFADTTASVIEIVGTGGQPDFVGTLAAEDASKVKPNMEAQVGTVTGRIVSVSPADPQTGLSSVRIVGAFSGSLGSSASAQVILQRDHGATAVPKEAVVDREGKTVVFRIEGDKAKMVEVVVLSEDGGFAEVTNVKVGDSLVKVGQYELSDGANVKVASAEKESGG